MPLAMKFSVVIPTHNPRLAYLERTIAGLKSQTLPHEQWELVVIDNRSAEPVAAKIDLGWHPKAKVVVEDKLGLTAARLRAIAETTADTIVFVDDDNVLAADYLTVLEHLLVQHPRIGVFGSGKSVPEYEIEPPQELMPYMVRLALRDLETSRWSNLRDYECTPWGAGMAIRREVALAFKHMVETNPQLELLGRSGTSLSSAEDLSICDNSIMAGYGNGIFTELRLTHLIPKRRVTHAYIFELIEAQASSLILFEALSGRPLSTSALHRCDFLGSIRRGRPVECVMRLSQALKLWRSGPAKQAAAAAERRGIRKALAKLQELGIEPGQQTAP